MLSEHNKDSFDDDFGADYESDDEDYFTIVGFDEDNARNQLFSYPNCTKVALDREVQAELGIEIGPNLSAEKPWKQIRKEVLEDFLTEDTAELQVLKLKLRDMEAGQLILFGYAAHLSDQEDVFIIFENEKNAKEASELIRKLEILDRLKARNLIVKQPRKWKSVRKEDDVVLERPDRGCYVEVQSTYPIRKAQAQFSMRYVEDARDGYVELTPGRNKIEIVYKKTNDMAIQCGSIPVHKEQQTDPTFPTNAWSQYLYEILEEKRIEKPNVEPETSKEVTPIPIHASDKIQNLLETLEFNKIDMYRDDYSQIAKKEFPKYQAPHLEETFCFAEIATTKNRFVSSMSWHPQYSGIVAVSYTFETLSTYIPIKQTPNIVQRTVLEKNPVLIWSFNDTLKPKLELFAPREVYTISFCPYDANILIGGMVSGDLVIWDLKERIEKIEMEEILTPEQAKNRQMTKEFLNWMETADFEKIVQPSAISNIEDSHLEAITSISWLPQNFYCTSTGLIKESPDAPKRHFITSSLDGSIYFWDLDSTPSDEDLKKRKIEKKFNIPKELEDIESPYKKFDLVLRPTYRLIIDKPITSVLIDEGKFRYEPLLVPKKKDITIRITHKILSEQKDHFEKALIFGTLAGEVGVGSWEGFDFNQGALVNQEKVQMEILPAVHDDPIVAMDRNPFVSDFSVSIGGTIFAIWKHGFNHAPIMWRRRGCRINAVKWSLDRPAVLYLILEDGTFEAWDFLAQTNEPSLIESLGGNIVTAISQHKLSLPRSVLAVGDYNSNLRIFLVPPVFVKQKQKEAEHLISQFRRIEKIMQDQIEWKKLWADHNKDLIEARKEAEEQAKPEMSKYRASQEEPRESVSTVKSKKESKLTFSDKMEKKWNEMNYERLLKVLMERRRVNPEMLEKMTRPQKDRRRYQAEKQEAVKQSFSKIQEELSELRSRLVPKEIVDDSRDKLVEAVSNEALRNMRDYNEVRVEALATVEKNAEKVHLFTMSEILERARQRREIIDRALGGNPDMMTKYMKEKQKRQQEKFSHLSADMVSLQRSRNNTSLMSDAKIDETSSLSML